MKYLIYELFSGVGFCNQLFSLETAIYLANISDRKLILLIRTPLCHCGKASWNYGKFLEFFSDDYKEFLPHGLDVHYGKISSDILDIINNEYITKKLIYKRRFSQLVFVDNNLNTEKNRDDIIKFVSGRTIEDLNFDDNQHYKYFYINQSNASRCFYNFYTTQYNYNIMNCIAKSLSILNYNISNIFNDINLPSQYVALHFRFGDRKHDTNQIQARNNNYLSNLDINKLKSLNTEIMIMCDRKDSLILNEFANINYRYTDKLIDSIKEKLRDTFDNIIDLSVIMFLLERLICDKSVIFYGNEGSTVSNYINYIRYINNLDYCNLYVNNENKIVKNNQISWRFNKIKGYISWPTFWTDNIIRNLEIKDVDYMNKSVVNNFSQDKFKAFYINMDNDIKRREHCDQLLKDIGFNAIERIIPIDINNEELVKSEIHCVCSKNMSAYKNKNELSINRPGGKYYKKPHGIKSLTHSHKRIWEKIIELNTDDYYFVFEDDIELVSEIERSKFLNILISDIKKMQKFNDVMYLGACLENAIWSNPKTDLNNVSCWGTHAYMINKNGAQYILDNILCWHQNVDYILRSLFKTNIFGSEYHCPYSRGHIGYLFQGRKESWYSLGMADEKDGIHKSISNKS
jgi:hypothetical protein